MYEYQIRHINHGAIHISELGVINEMVAQGYRLVSVAPYDGGNSLYFERPKQ